MICQLLKCVTLLALFNVKYYYKSHWVACDLFIIRRCHCAFHFFAPEDNSFVRFVSLGTFSSSPLSLFPFLSVPNEGRMEGVAQTCQKFRLSPRHQFWRGKMMCHLLQLIRHLLCYEKILVKNSNVCLPPSSKNLSLYLSLPRHSNCVIVVVATFLLDPDEDVPLPQLSV